MGSEKRDNQYEVIRVIAMLFVVGVHVAGSLPTDTPLRMFNWHLFSQVFFTCNGLFYMLSGKFALLSNPKTKKEYLQYYHKKIINLLVPVIFYMFLRSAYEGNWQINNILFWKECMQNILNGYSECEYWFLYSLVGNLLLAPFISKAFVNASEKELCLFLSLGVGYNALITYLPYFFGGGGRGMELPAWGVVYIFLPWILLRTDNKFQQKTKDGNTSGGHQFHNYFCTKAVWLVY